MKKPKQLKGLEAWEAKYYPVEASKVSKKDALAHSLRKWKGLRKDVLEKYGINRIVEFLLFSSGRGFPITCRTCALCHIHASCKPCPLVKYNDKHTYLGDTCGSAYDAFLVLGDPEPMIKLLQKALKKQKAKGKPRKVK